MKKNLILLGFLIALAVPVWYGYRQKKTKSPPAKRLFSFIEDDACKWEIMWKGNHIICEKFSNQWYIVYPEKSFAEQAEVIANVKNFNTADYILAVQDNTNSLARWGLDRTENWYRIWVKDNKGIPAEFTIYEGNASQAPQGFYARFSGSSNVYSLEHWVIMALRKSIADLRYRSFFPPEPETIIGVKYGPVTITRNEEDLTWRVNDLPTNEINMRTVDDIVQALGYMKAFKVYESDETDKFNLSTSFLTITVQSTDGKSLKGAAAVTGQSEKINTYVLTLYNHLNKVYATVPWSSRIYELMDSFGKVFITNTRQFHPGYTAPDPMY